MRFVRHLLAASVAVALIVGLSFMWKGSSAASLVADGRGDRGGRGRVEQGFDGSGVRPPADGARPGPGDERFGDGPFGDGPFGERRFGERRFGERRFERRSGGAFSLSNADELASTIVPLALIIGVVVAVDASRRRKRSAARRAAVARLRATPAAAPEWCSAARTLPGMSVVRINAIEVPEGMGPMLEERFAQRLGAVDQQPGFEGFELLRPTGAEESRYFVVTHWASAEDFDAWVNSPAFGQGHAGPPAGEGGHGAPAGHGGHGGQAPVASGSSVLEFDVVLSSAPTG